MSKKYVPDGVWLTCSCGTCISQFKVTMHKLTTIYGSNMATEGDRWPFLNIKPFGLCSSRLSACVPSPVIWKNTKEGIFIGNNRMLLEDSQATCLFGGTITIHFSQISAMAAAPLGSFKKPSEYIKEGFDWTFDNLHKGTNALKSGLTKAGAPSWLLSGVDNLAWNIEFTQSITEGAVNAVVGLGEVVWDISQDPVGVGSAICGAVADGATSAWEWSTNGDNWVKLGNDSWDYVTSPDQWAETAKNAGDWIQKNPRKLGNITGEIVETIGEVVLTAGAASAAKKGIQKGVQKGVKQTTKELTEEIVEKDIKIVAKNNIKKDVNKKIAYVVTRSLREAVEESRLAFKRAIEAAKKLPQSQQGKTVASDSFKTISGYARDRVSKRTRNAIGNVHDVNPNDIMYRAENEFGYKMTKNSSIDHKNPGSAYASHAEKQLMHETDDAIGVNRKTCSSCEEYAQKKADATGEAVVITDPKGTKIYQKGKSPVKIKHNESLDNKGLD